jgi:hypothetical protein
MILTLFSSLISHAIWWDTLSRRGRRERTFSPARSTEIPRIGSQGVPLSWIPKALCRRADTFYLSASVSHFLLTHLSGSSGILESPRELLSILNTLDALYRLVEIPTLGPNKHSQTSIIPQLEWRIISPLLVRLFSVLRPERHTGDSQFNERRSQIDFEPFWSTDSDTEGTTFWTDGCPLSLDVELPWVHQWLKVRVGQVEVPDTRRKRSRSFQLHHQFCPRLQATRNSHRQTNPAMTP